MCRRLAGRSFTLEITGGTAAFARTCLRSDGSTLHIERAGAEQPAPAQSGADHASPPGAADVTLSGSPIALLGLLRTPAQALIQNGALRVDGDAEIARQFSELLALLKPDPEELVGQLIGRVPAHGAMRALRGALGYGRGALKSGSLALADWLAHEKRELIPQAESEHQRRGIETLGEQLDRADARLAFATERAAALEARRR